MQPAAESSRPHAAAHPAVVLAICCSSLLMVAMDTTIVNVALPAIRADLHTSVAGLQWVVDAYTLVLASFLVLGGSSADRFGRRRVFQIGLATFTAGSLLCSLAHGVGALVAARVVQALGGSMLNPVAMSIIVHTFVEPAARARAIGVWGAMSGVSMAAGPLAGGLLTQVFDWHAVFWVNVPIGIAAALLTARYVPESRAPRARRGDPAGQALFLAGLAGLTYALIESPRDPGAAALSALLAAAAVGGLLALEPRLEQPLLDLRFFRSLPFASATLIAVLMFSALGCFLFLNTLYLQEVRGLSALRAGLCTLPTALAVILVSPLSGRLVAARGARPSLLASGLMLTASALLLTRLDAHTPLPLLLSSYAAFGVGFGFVNAPVTYAAVSGMPRAQAGLASAIASTSRQVGATLGVAAAGAVASGRLGARLDWADFPAATHAVWWLLVGSGIAVSALGWLATGARGRASAERVAHLLEEPARA